jgi:replicative DNA helicase Mcm
VKDEPVKTPEQVWELILTRNCKKQVAILTHNYPHTKTLLIPYPEVIKVGEGGLRVADEIVEFPGKAIEDCLEAINRLHILEVDGKPARGIKVRFEKLPRKTPIKDIREKHTDKLLAIEVLVKRISEVRPRCTMGAYRCAAGHFTFIHQPYWKMIEPKSCGTDGCNFRTFDLIPKRSTFIDTQTILVQEILDNMLGGEQPRIMPAEITEELVQSVRPGDRVVINAILRQHPQMKAGTTSPVFKTYLEVNNIEIYERDYADVTVTADDEEKIFALAADPNVLDNVANSIVPSIYGLDDVKRAIALSLFGGKQFKDAAGNAKRRDIHMLLCFDPGMAKSYIGKAVARIAPRGLFVSGQSSSKAGLTVTLTKDEGDGRWMVEAGAMVLADGGTIIIDELGHLPKPEQSALHETMESQTASYAKAGMVGDMNTRCNVIALMNPKQGRFDPTVEFSEQIDMAPALLSRFDLIFLKQDVPQDENDAGVARAIISDHSELPDATIPPDLLRKFIAFSKKQENPTLSKEASDAIVLFYQKVRKQASGAKAVPLTARVVEGAYRLAIAHAKMRLSPVAEMVDAEIAIDLLTTSLKQVAFDQNTGSFDGGAFGGYGSRRQRDFRDTLMKAIETVEDKDSRMAKKDNIIAEMSRINAGDRDKVISALDRLAQEGILMKPKHDWYKRM